MLKKIAAFLRKKFKRKPTIHELYFGGKKK